MAMMMNDDAKTVRQTASPLRLLMQAAGGPSLWIDKIRRGLRTTAVWFNRPEIRRRLERLRSKGFMETIPSGRQLAVGGLDMVRYFISPGAKSYYETRGIHFGFHQVLRFLDDPVSVIDPVGVLSERDTIIGHVMQVVHANPLYDVQLLEMFEDGVDELERQTAQMVDGTHPRQATIGAIIEDPTYHARLLAWLREYRVNPEVEEMRRETGTARQSKGFVLAEETFGNLPGFMRYAARLPDAWGPLLGHLREKAEIDPAYCDSETVAAVEARFAS